MPTWLNVAIWIIMILWTLFEIANLNEIIERNKIRSRIGKTPLQYTNFGAFTTFLWIILLILWLCYNIFG